MFRILSKKHQKEDLVRVRLITTVILSPSSLSSTDELTYHVPPGQKSGYFSVTCRDGSVLGILELQPQGKKVMTAKAFNNGLREKIVHWLPIQGSQHIQPDRNGH